MRSPIANGVVRPLASIVIPVFNERENLQALIDRLIPSAESAAGPSFEVVFVDDGSDDGSPERLDAMSMDDHRIKVVHLSRNFGHQAALQAGLDVAAGQCVVLMDADLQDPPELLADLLRHWRDGYQVVSATRRRRREGLAKRAAYALFYRSLKMIANIDVPLDTGDFCLLDRSVVDTLNTLPERNRFLRGLRSWVGFRQTRIEYDRAARYAGAPKYTLRKLIHLAVSGYVGFSAMPLRAAAWLGFASACVGFAIAVWAIATKLMRIPSPRGWASLIAVILFIGGVQLVMLGVIGEYLGRVYDEVRQRPLYIVRGRTGFAQSKRNAETRESLTDAFQ